MHRAVQDSGTAGKSMGFGVRKLGLWAALRLRSCGTSCSSVKCRELCPRRSRGGSTQLASKDLEGEETCSHKGATPLTAGTQVTPHCSALSAHKVSITACLTSASPLSNFFPVPTFQAVLGSSFPECLKGPGTELDTVVTRRVRKAAFAP